ncbi:MAG: hypothetical protein EA353_07635 [Puniceicoccaceae bacterium]|nr:MAG: hypothetical protein EA353_07635 [Puniceicoccaceae bacterium]
MIVNATDGTINDTLSNLFSKRQLGLIATASSDPQSVENRFTHDISLSSYSVFQKPGTGGLKENIADQGIMTASPLGEAGWKLLNAAAALDTALPTPAPSEVAEGEAFFEPLPIPTEIALYIGFFHTRSDARIRIRYHLETELWNPYSRNLRFPRDASDNRFPNRALYVEFVNMPNFRVEELPGGTEPPVAPIIEGNMDMMFSGAQSLIEDSIHSWVEIQPDTDRGRNLPPGMLGGEIYRALEPNPNSQAQGLARSVVDYTASPNLLWSENQSQRPPPEATIRLTFTPSDTGNPEIIIREWNVGDPKAGRIIARYQNLPFFKDEFDQNDKYVLEKGFETGPNPFSRATSNTYLRDDYNLAFHVRLASDENEPGALKHIFSTLDLRDRTIDYSENFVTAEEQTISMSDLIDSVSWNPVLAQQLDSDIFSDLDLFATDRTNEHGENLNPIIAFDIPTRNAASLSVFKALPFRERKAFSLGSPWGGSINDLFDDYYFGTDPTLPNQAKNHRIVDLTKDSESATTPLLADRLSSALLAGGFNINSTSARAWSAIFGLLLRYQNGGELEVTHAFFRTPLYAAAEGKAIPLPFVTGGEDGSAPLPPADQQYNLGSRRLSSDQLRALGEVTAAAIRDREEPFLSVADFINSGILQQAIDLAHDQSAIDSNGFTGVTAAEDPINPSGALKYSHAYLTQNDIISRIGHMLTHRSDTFTIRVSASSTNPLNGQTLGEATLEATVQRFPDKMDGSDPKTPTSANEITDNRTFRLVNLKWIEGSPGI